MIKYFLLQILFFYICVELNASTDSIPLHHIIISEKNNYKITIYDDLHLIRKRTLFVAGVSIISGISYGIHETVVHKPFRIPENWNMQWWDARESWKNKYKNNDPRQGQAFPGSMGAFVWVTDAKHLFGGIYRVSMFASGVVAVIGEKRPLRHYIAQAFVSGLFFSVGFSSIYYTNIIFK